ncbi:protein kinase domain-containing protein [Archangium sp.]|uniref:serine/threonine-protein kinase n=1 Tax=Archangium sp. TaxID=1872627 RepID=UPI00286AADA6|nr:protein kinase [Archangium sp.]
MNESSRYRLVRPLASGGMAELFLGVARGAEGFEKPVAIKRMLPHLAREPAIAQMFLAEARLATHLQHQNIASVYDVGSGPDGLFLVMELVNGWDLGVLLRHAWRRGQRFPPHLVAFIGAQVLAGLVHAYRRTHAGRPVMTAHRDISPSNILVSREGEVKVTDFGIARIEGASLGTQPGTFKGKLPYSAPEALHGEPATALSDQFSLGIVLYELLAGRHPFGEGTDEPMAFAMAITQQEPAPLTGIPAPLVAVVSRAMAKDPAARFPRPEDMGEALARYLAQAGEPASSQSLATFLASLNLPPTLLELSESSEEQLLSPPSGAQESSMAPTVRRPSVSTQSVNPSSFELQHTEPWVEQPGGLALSMSGRMVMPTGTGTGTATAPPAPARDLHPDLSTLAEDIQVVTPPPSPQTSRPQPSRPQAAPAAPLRSVLDMKEEELQLAERAPRPASNFPVDNGAPLWRRVLRPMKFLAVQLLVAGGLVVAWPHLTKVAITLRYKLGPTPPMTQLSIQTDPPGATVIVDGQELGTTPLVIDNAYPRQEIPLKLTLKGFKPWTGTFAGGQPESLDVRLRR